MSKNNRKNQSVELLQRVLTLLPNEKAKRHVRIALEEINKTDKKKKKKEEQETIEQKWREDLKSGLVNPLDGKRTLDTIEAMIEAENSKIEELKKEKEATKNTTTSTLLD